MSPEPYCKSICIILPLDFSSIVIANVFAIKLPCLHEASKEMRRKTNQKNAIEEVFRQQDRPLGIEEIVMSGRRIVESLNQATVYRNLKLLVERGWLRKINTPELGSLYERAGKGHHHHFQCRFCDHLFEIPGCTMKEEQPAPPGFVIEGHEVFLFGICSACRQ